MPDRLALVRRLLPALQRPLIRWRILLIAVVVIGLAVVLL